MNTQTETALANIYMAQKAFLWSLGTGTVIEMAMLMTNWHWFALVAFFYTIAVVLFNLIVFLNNIIFMCFNTEYRFKLLGYTLLMLLNIPIAIFYFFMLFNPILLPKY